jgi:hypothetical protein
MVTHSSTSRPVQCLCMAERTGCPVFIDLWSYVFFNQYNTIIKDGQKCPRLPPRVEQSKQDLPEILPMLLPDQKLTGT